MLQKNCRFCNSLVSTMPIYTSFWERIAEDLKNEHSDKQSPYEWKKSEIKSFITDRFLVRIDKYLKINEKNDGQAPTFTYHTFRRIFKTEKYQAGTYTKNLFAWYFGYPDADAYLKAERMAERPKLSTVKHFIDQAMQAEFNAYKSVPACNDAIKALESYFLREGPAFKKIINVLDNQSSRGWLLTNSNNPSAHEVIDVKIQETFRDKAIVKTHEHWVIQWYSPVERAYKFSYNNTNQQNYILKKVDARWKIWSNSYAASEKYLPPLDIAPELKVQIDAQSGLECRNAFLKMIEEGKTSVAFYLLKTKLKDTPHLNKVIVFKSQFDQLIDRVNNEKISIETFYSKKGEIDLKLLDLLESL